MLSSLNLLATSATSEETAPSPPVDMRSSARVHVPIAPNPHPSARSSDPSSSVSPDQHSQYKIRTRRARPLIQNKCEECVVARQKCTWSTSSDSCDRCRRLDKKCRARESSSSTSMGFKDDERTMTPEAGIQPLNDLSGISQSTASAALALTALARNDERIVAEPVIVPKHSPTAYAPPIPHPNVYSVQESDFKPVSRQTLPRSPLFFPEITMEKPGLKRKLPKKGNNPHGNVGTYKCARCRELKAKCLYTQEDRPCKRCSTAGKSCGPKTLARENESAAKAAASRTPTSSSMSGSMDTHKPLHLPHPHAHQHTSSSLGSAGLSPPSNMRPIHHQWPVNKPILPRIIEMVGPEFTAQVAGKLNNELSILYSKVNAEPAFKPPPGMTDGGIAPQQPQSSGQGGSGQGVAGNMMGGIEGQQRSGRAVSLPPNPQLIHREGEGVGGPSSNMDGDHDLKKEEIPMSIPNNNHNERTVIKVESLMSPPAPMENKRSLGDGIPQYQPYCCQCAIEHGIHATYAKPASSHQFNQHPKGVCRVYHRRAVQWALGCSVHRGVLDDNGRCDECMSEKKNGMFYPPLLLRETVGYPGDEAL